MDWSFGVYAGRLCGIGSPPPQMARGWRLKSVEDLKPLTSLRFIAAMMIVLLHAQQYFAAQWTWLSLVPGAAVHGVSFLFVLSGFILTHVYRSRPFPGYGRFILTRFARLWPIHVFALLVLVTFVRQDFITFDGPDIFSKWVVLAYQSCGCFNPLCPLSLICFRGTRFRGAYRRSSIFT